MLSSGEQDAVKAGQLLNDVVIERAPWPDHWVLRHAAKARFEADPSALMGGELRRIKVGAALNVPLLEALGNAAASGPQATNAASEEGPSPDVAPSEVAVGLAASTAAVAASSAAPETSSAAYASSASATFAVLAAPQAGMASAGQPASAGAAGRSGSAAAIQRSASAAAEVSAHEGRTTARAVAAPPPASAAHPHVSSLQQLLELKNSALMALQEHGFGPPRQVAEAGAPVVTASAATGQRPVPASHTFGTVAAAAPASTPMTVPASRAETGKLAFGGWQLGLGARSIAIAALLALFAGLVIRIRKRVATGTDLVRVGAKAREVKIDSALAATPSETTRPGTSQVVPQPFPADVVSALNNLNLTLPQRVESTPVESPPRVLDNEVAVPSPVSRTTQPVVTPEMTERQAVRPFEPEAPSVADAIEAGIAGPASVAGLGAARFGTLNLNFDLDLPEAASPLPVFTPEELAHIARNKLDLAHEYIALGDFSGARILINEVIESNDAATSHEARALLSTLAPLS